MMQKRVFIVHGWGGSPHQNDWLPWLKKELEKKNFSAVVPLMPNTENPKIETWVPHLAKIVNNADKNTFFVGHSIGCQTILRYLEGLSENKKVGGAVFVAGWLTKLNGLDSEEKEIEKPWLETKIDFGKVKLHLPKSVAIFSDNDPYVPLDNQNDFREKLGSKIIIQNNMAHFNEAAGVAKLPIALSSLLEIIS